MRDETVAAGAGVDAGGGVGAEAGADVGVGCDSGWGSGCASGSTSGATAVKVSGCCSISSWLFQRTDCSTSVCTGVSVESIIVTSAVSVAGTPFVMGVGDGSATCSAPFGVGSAMLYIWGRR